MQYRIDKSGLFETLSVWDGYLKKKVHLIACGGTAITLLNIKESTKDIDFLVPNPTEYEYLLKILKELGYEPKTGHGWGRDDGFIFDLFSGNRIFTTELLESPLKEGNHTLVREFANIYVGVLNYYDLIISKVFRSSTTDLEDCLALIRVKGNEIDINRVRDRFYETSSYDVADEKNRRNLEYFMAFLKKNGVSI